MPLSDATIAVLKAVPRVDDYPYAFPGIRYGRPLSNMALLQLMRRIGYGINCDRGDYVPHGFRSSFRDWSARYPAFRAM